MPKINEKCPVSQTPLKLFTGYIPAFISFLEALMNFKLIG